MEALEFKNEVQMLLYKTELFEVDEYREVSRLLEDFSALLNKYPEGTDNMVFDTISVIRRNLGQARSSKKKDALLADAICQLQAELKLILQDNRLSS